jgi:hypothetical protein
VLVHAEPNYFVRVGPCGLIELPIGGIAPSLSLASIARIGLACFRALRRNARFDTTVSQRDRDRNNLNFGHAVGKRVANTVLTVHRSQAASASGLSI